MEWQVDRSSQVFRQYQLERISQMISQGKGMSTTGFPVLQSKNHPDAVAFGELAVNDHLP